MHHLPTLPWKTRGLDSTLCPCSLKLCCPFTHSPRVSAMAQQEVLGSSWFPSLCIPVHFTEYNDRHGIFDRGGGWKVLILRTLRTVTQVSCSVTEPQPEIETEFGAGIRRHHSWMYCRWIFAFSPTHTHMHIPHLCRGVFVATLPKLTIALWTCYCDPPLG